MQKASLLQQKRKSKMVRQAKISRKKRDEGQIKGVETQIKKR